jgi:hypothetical protein
MMALHLDALPLWLATIDAARVAPAIRAKIERQRRQEIQLLLLPEERVDGFQRMRPQDVSGKWRVLLLLRLW